MKQLAFESNLRDPWIDCVLASNSGPFGTVLASPPWSNAETSLAQLSAIPVVDIAADKSHLYLRLPPGRLEEGISLMAEWGFDYKTNLIRLQTAPYVEADSLEGDLGFQNILEMVLFGVRGRLRTLAPGRKQVNLFSAPQGPGTPDELYQIIEDCSPGLYLEIWGNQRRHRWRSWSPPLSGARDPEKVL